MCVSPSILKISSFFFLDRGARTRERGFSILSPLSLSLMLCLSTTRKYVYMWTLRYERQRLEQRINSLTHSLSLGIKPNSHCNKMNYRIRPPFNLRSTKSLWDVSRSVFRSEESASSPTLSTFRTESTDSIRTPVRIRRNKRRRSIGCV